MSTELIDQLDAYGHWLEQHCAATMRSNSAAVTPESDIDVSDVAEVGATSRSSSLTGRRLMLAAAVVVLAATAVVALWSRRSTPTGPAGLPADPDGPLFMLPTGDDLVLSDGTVWKVTSDSAATGVVNAMVIGRPDGDAFVGLVGITDTHDRPDSSPADSWIEIDTTTGKALVSAGALPMAIQQRGDRWIRLTNVVDQQTITDLLQSITLTADGIAFVPVDGFVAVDGFTGIAPVPNAVYSVASSDGAENFTVSSASASSPLFGALLAERLDPVTINGRNGWLVSIESEGGSRHSVVWQVTANRIVAVSGNATDQQFLDLARRLQMVDRETWTAALPGYSTDGP